MLIFYNDLDSNLKFKNNLTINLQNKLSKND